MTPLALTAAEQMRETPILVWIKFGGLILCFILAILILRKIMQVNKFILLTLVFIGGSIVLLNWTYTRTEPKILTPLIDEIAPFLPGGSGLEAPSIDPNDPSSAKKPKKT